MPASSTSASRLTFSYGLQDPKLKEEVIDEILDILEILRLSKLLSMDIVRGVAMLITAFLRVRNSSHQDLSRDILRLVLLQLCKQYIKQDLGAGSTLYLKWHVL